MIIDKSITKEDDGYHVHIRYAQANINYGPYVRYEEAAAVYDDAPRSSLDCEPCFAPTPRVAKPSKLQGWFERKLEREDLFEELCVEAEACR